MRWQVGTKADTRGQHIERIQILRWDLSRLLPGALSPADVFAFLFSHLLEPFQSGTTAILDFEVASVPAGVFDLSEVVVVASSAPDLGLGLLIERPRVEQARKVVNARGATFPGQEALELGQQEARCGKEPESRERVHRGLAHFQFRISGMSWPCFLMSFTTAMSNGVVVVPSSLYPRTCRFLWFLRRYVSL